MLLKIGAIAALLFIGFVVGHNSLKPEGVLGEPASFGVLKRIGAAIVPIAFAYGGWQTATFVAAEMRDARRDLSRGLLIGVGSVVDLYLAANLACLRVLGPTLLDHTTTHAAALRGMVRGQRSAQCTATA